MSNIQKAIAKALDNTTHLKGMDMIVGTEGVKNFFVIHETELLRVGIKLTAAGMFGQMLCMRVRVVTKAGCVVGLEKLFEDEYKDKMIEAQCEGVKVDNTRISFIIPANITINDELIYTLEVDEVVKELLTNTIKILNTVFGMSLDRSGFRPVLRELCAMGLPRGVEELSGMDVKTGGVKKEKTGGSVTSIDKNKKQEKDDELDK